MGDKGDLFGLEFKWRTGVTNYGSLCEEQGWRGAVEGKLGAGFAGIARRRNKAGLDLFMEAARIEHRQRKLERALRDLVGKLEDTMGGRRMSPMYKQYMEERLAPELEAAYALLREGPVE